MTSEFPCAFELHVKDELREVDLEQRFCDMLDECYSFEKVGGPFAYMSPSAVLKEMSPTDYRIGVSEQSDADDDNLYDIDGEYYDSREVDDLFDSWKADQPACKHCGDALVKIEDHEGTAWLDADNWQGRNAHVCGDNEAGDVHEPEGDDDSDDDSADACKGCGCVPGDGITDGCNDPDGCGYLRDFERVTGTPSALKKDE